MNDGEATTRLSNCKPMGEDESEKDHTKYGWIATQRMVWGQGSETLDVMEKSR